MAKRDWDIVTSYIDKVETSDKVVSFGKIQDSVRVKNQGNVNLIYTIGTKSGTLAPNTSIIVSENLSSFTVKATSGVCSFEVRSTEAGTEQEEIAPVSGGSGLLTYATVSDLQTAYPSGTTYPVWVRSENAWYYWSGEVVTNPPVEPPTGGADTTAPILTITPSATFTTTQNVVMSTNETATIYYTLDDTDPKTSGTKLTYSNPLTLTETDTIKAYAVDSANNESTVQTVTYTKQAETPPVTDSYALNFNGTNSVATSANNLGVTGANARSIEVRFKTPDTIQNGAIVAFGGNVASQMNEICIRNSQIFLDKGAIGLVNVATTVTASTWYHVVYTYDGTTLNGYVNGTFKRGEAATLATTDTPVKLGQGISGYLKGDVDFVRVYNRSLTATEVTNNKNGTVTRDGLVGEWLITEGTGTAIADTAGANAMTASNTTWVANA
jgi:Concanavalin A-like lectin/glucanases superfamily/Chitobiase/beta-hexosaminidase C-terminal domain